jgi:S-phase kinase-associated protein 1
VSGDVLQRVIEYMAFHETTAAPEIDKPLRSANLADCGVSAQDVSFVDVGQEELFNLILAANYMDIKPLLDLACAKVASMLKGKTPEAIRKQFDIVNDFTPEQEEAIKAENRWADESHTTN